MQNVYELARIAVYLNLVTIKLKAEAGDVSWFTGTEQTIAGCAGGGASQETQCLSFGAALWIANNDDRDTEIQRNFLNAVGVKKPSTLLQHTGTYGHLALPYHAHNFVPGAMTPKQRFFHKLLKEKVGDDRTRYKPAHTVANPGYSITSGNVPGVSGIVFVRGSYNGDGGGAEHAEQKLLAALSWAWDNELVPGMVSVGGCKSACGTCAGVLRDTKERLAPGIILDYVNAKANEQRTESDLGTDNNDGIKRLDIDHYFTAA